MARAIQQAVHWVPHSPSSRQTDFLSLDCAEALYGGAAGGGKTDALLMGALQYVDVKDYAAAIFRRNKPELFMPGGPADLARKWLQHTPARWDDEESTWYFPSGAKLHFGYAPNFSALTRRYQGPAFQYVGIDELTQWTERMYLYLFSRTRKLIGANVPLRVRSTANPGGIGHTWVKKRFVENARHLRGSDARTDIRERNRGTPLPAPAVYRSPASDEEMRLCSELGAQPQGAHFVPAALRDNPGLDQATYRLNLARLDVVTRKQLEAGDWDVLSAGNLFAASWLKFLPARPAGLTWVRSWDLAATAADARKDPDWTAGALCAAELLPTQDHRLVIADMRHFQKNPGETEREVQTTAKLDGLRVHQLIEQEPGSAGKSVVNGYRSRVLFGHKVHAFPRTGPKEEYWRPMSALAEAGNVYLVEGDWNADFVEELVNLPVGHDDQADAAAAALAWLAGDGAYARTAALLAAPM